LAIGKERGLEWWSDGKKQELQYSITPSLQYSSTPGCCTEVHFEVFCEKNPDPEGVHIYFILNGDDS